MVTEKGSSTAADNAIDEARAFAQVAATQAALVVEDGLFTKTYSFRILGRALSTLAPQLTRLTAWGHTFSARVEAPGDLSVTWHGDDDPDLVGDPELVLLDPSARLALSRAIAASQVDAALEVLADQTFEATATLSFSNMSTAWIPSLEQLISRLSDGRWASTMLQLRRQASRNADQIATFVVDDLSEDQTLITRSFRFTGQSKAEQLAAGVADRAQREFIAARVERGWAELPTPDDLLLAPGQSDSELHSALESAAPLLVWYWLAASPPDLTANDVNVLFRGVRHLSIELLPRPCVTGAERTHGVELWRWASAGYDPAREDAVQQAITLAAQSGDELVAAGEPALRTARSLYELASRALISEALAARRSGREAAAGAARAAASTAREVAGKAMERSLGLSVAATAAVFASLQKVLDWRVSFTALGVLVVVFIGAAVLARRVDLRSATDALDSFIIDLDQYADTLGSEDIDALRSLDVIEKSRQGVKRAQCAVFAVYLVAVTLAVAMAVALAVQRP